jgi:hypothetical protein
MVMVTLREREPFFFFYRTCVSLNGVRCIFTMDRMGFGSGEKGFIDLSSWVGVLAAT